MGDERLGGRVRTAVGSCFRRGHGCGLRRAGHDGSNSLSTLSPTRRRALPRVTPTPALAVARVTTKLSQNPVGRHLVFVQCNITSEDEVMEPRFNLFGNEIAATFAKRFASASLVIHHSPLPQSTQELVSLRASQINGCGWCIDMHTKEAAAAGETAVRLNLVAAWRESTVFTEAEQAALALAEEGTRLADAHRRIRRDLGPGAQALRRRRDRGAGRPGRHDQRGQPARRDRAPAGRFLRARHARPHDELTARTPPS